MRAIVSLFFAVFLMAQGFNLDRALWQLEKGLDLSKKTRVKNSGITIIYTRRDLEQLGIRTLREILQRTPIGWRRSRYGLVDPLDIALSMTPIGNCPVKVFIDDVEVVSGSYNNGIAIVGDMDLGFVDHIEIYLQNPALHILQEPAFILIKLYSKDPAREAKGDVEVSFDGSERMAYVQGAPSKKLYVYGGYTLDKDRDLRQYHLDKEEQRCFASFSKGKSRWTLFAYAREDGGFLGPDLFRVPDRSLLRSRYIQLGYEYKEENARLQADIHFFKSKINYRDERTLVMLHGRPFKSLYVSSYDYVGGLSYQKRMHLTKKGEFHYGIKYRYKGAHYSDIRLDNLEGRNFGFKKEHVFNPYFQYNYFYRPNVVFNAGMMKGAVINQKGVKNYYPTLLRAGVTYLPNEHWTFQGQYAHMEIYPDPYILRSFYIPKNGLQMVKVENILLNNEYAKENMKFSLALGYFTSPNYALPNMQGKLVNIKNRMGEYYLSMEYRNDYRPYSSILFRYYAQRIAHLPHINYFFLHKFIVEHQQKLGKLTFSQALVYDKKGPIGRLRSGLDVDCFIEYDLSPSFSIFFKGENIFKSEYKDRYITLNPFNFQPKMLSIPSVTRHLMVGLHWSF